MPARAGAGLEANQTAFPKIAATNKNGFCPRCCYTLKMIPTKLIYRKLELDRTARLRKGRSRVLPPTNEKTGNLRFQTLFRGGLVFLRVSTCGFDVDQKLSADIALMSSEGHFNRM